MTTTFPIGHYFRLINDDNVTVVSLQNFFISETVSHEGGTYLFSPFGFSGLNTSRQGDLEPAELVFPNNPLSRGYLVDSLRGMSYVDSDGGEDRPWKRPYIGEVDVCIVDPTAKTVATKLFTYTGQCTGGGFDDTALSLELSSLLDAVQTNVPQRTLIQRIVGNLPLGASVRLN